ncbi:hypothetical protein NMY22_g904 [Coprinellus aureogranulatus]|nr:hypothetical protein NMY22_g904 [Coprinellus aureogranulatus]
MNTAKQDAMDSWGAAKKATNPGQRKKLEKQCKKAEQSESENCVRMNCLKDIHTIFLSEGGDSTLFQKFKAYVHDAPKRSKPIFIKEIAQEGQARSDNLRAAEKAGDKVWRISTTIIRVDEIPEDQVNSLMKKYIVETPEDAKAGLESGVLKEGEYVVLGGNTNRLVAPDPNRTDQACGVTFFKRNHLQDNEVTANKIFAGVVYNPEKALECLGVKKEFNWEHVRMSQELLLQKTRLDHRRLNTTGKMTKGTGPQLIFGYPYAVDFNGGVPLPDVDGLYGEHDVKIPIGHLDIFVKSMQEAFFQGFLPELASKHMAAAQEHALVNDLGFPNISFFATVDYCSSPHFDDDLCPTLGHCTHWSSNIRGKTRHDPDPWIRVTRGNKPVWVRVKPPKLRVRRLRRIVLLQRVFEGTLLIDLVRSYLASPRVMASEPRVRHSSGRFGGCQLIIVDDHDTLLYAFFRFPLPRSLSFSFSNASPTVRLAEPLWTRSRPPILPLDVERAVVRPIRQQRAPATPVSPPARTLPRLRTCDVRAATSAFSTPSRLSATILAEKREKSWKDDRQYCRPAILLRQGRATLSAGMFSSPFPNSPSPHPFASHRLLSNARLVFRASHQHDVDRVNVSIDASASKSDHSCVTGGTRVNTKVPWTLLQLVNPRLVVIVVQYLVLKLPILGIALVSEDQVAFVGRNASTRFACGNCGASRSWYLPPKTPFHWRLSTP